MTIRLPASFLCLMMVASLLIGGCASTKQNQPPPLYGTWFFTMNSPSAGELTGNMTISEAEDGTYMGHISLNEMSIDEEMQIKSLEMDRETGAFTLKGFAAGTDFTMQGTVMGDTITGINSVATAGEFSLEATRIEDSM